MNYSFKATLFSLLGFIGLGVVAADGGTVAEAHFNPKINAWAEGTVMTVDADNAKFTIRGTKRAYSTAYAKMLQEINAKTSNLDPGAATKKAQEIRNSWHDALVKASKEEPGAASDFTFRLPGKDSKMMVYDETQFYDRDPKNTPPGADVKMTDRERSAMVQLKDLKVGETVVVGYDGGVVFNDAYTLIKIASKEKKVSTK